MFHVGQLVVCVDDENIVSPGPVVCRGTVYEVVALHRRATNRTTGKVGAGIDVNGIDPQFGCFDVDRFRPVNDSALDIFRKTEATTPTERESA